MATDSSIKIPGSPDLLETVKTADHKHREGMFLGDPQTDAARAKITNAAPAADSYGLAVRFPDSAMFDAFSRLRTSHPTGLFQTQCQYDAEPLLLETGATGTGVAPAHSANTRMVALSATAGNGTSFIQSYEYIPYQAGKSQLIFVTGVFGSAVAGATVDQGAFDAANGIFLRQNGANGMQFVLRSSTSGGVLHNTADQVDWSEDTLDGNGSSGITLDVTKSQILVIDAQFLAMGRVRCGFD
ncbi:MAG: hypothetical protein KKB70_05340, partial [Proteobacteria bacterium]|nr:hypothetical protein [Pseudomonadota bacterium]